MGHWGQSFCPGGFFGTSGTVFLSRFFWFFKCAEPSVSMVVGHKKNTTDHQRCHFCEATSYSHRGFPQLPSSLSSKRDDRRISASPASLRCSCTQYTALLSLLGSLNSLVLPLLESYLFMFCFLYNLCFLNRAEPSVSMVVGHKNTTDYQRCHFCEATSYSHRGCPQLPSSLSSKRDDRRISASPASLRCSCTQYTALLSPWFLELLGPPTFSNLTYSCFAFYI
ncbi:hypothetical protein UACE39S_04389 [Ureibacillus acetophenoni]